MLERLEELAQVYACKHIVVGVNSNYPLFKEELKLIEEDGFDSVYSKFFQFPYYNTSKHERSKAYTVNKKRTRLQPQIKKAN